MLDSLSAQPCPQSAAASVAPTVRWVENNENRSAVWRSANGAPPPAELVAVDDRITAEAALRLASAGTAMVWRGDFHGANQLLNALRRRVDHKAKVRPATDFHAYRQARARRARILGMLVVPMDSGHVISLRRAPDVRRACLHAYGESTGPALVSLRELRGVTSAYEWCKEGVEVPALGARIHPHYGVFSPVRGEYVDLVARAPLPSTRLAFDIGTGSGVLAAVLARRGVESIVATDDDPRALACARENLNRLGYGDRVELVRTDLYPRGRAPLVVCNPPWVPAKPRSPLDHAVYDSGGRVLSALLDRMTRHLTADGEGWLVISDLAEHLGLRSRTDLLAAFDAANLTVLERIDTRPRHRRARDTTDPLHAARAAEITSLWRLTPN
ncbi:class I SAM-dependent methyltransferase [Nocardia sp. CDC160]|uniref:class I SAM-dependent methyltransferase n=1 Tax=Nocardia sp. CDC160 TaxID=3112166 RepID=UPI002DBD8972|nr:class I SAM-dependent methyltransferase [Nocardia sp. CDC160]MEC3915007.1 class I SAM-dependent methyltransferase [Nocardia sp. CDC160]